MNCNNCQRIKSLYTCATIINIGSGFEPEIGYLVYFQASSTDKIIVVGAESNIDGEMFIDEIPEFLADTDYQVWVTLNPPDAVKEIVPFLIDDVEVDCVTVRFNRVYDLDNVTVTELEQTFVLE